MHRSTILLVSELYWPEGTGGILASHLIANILKNAGFRLTIIHGTKQPKTIEGLNYVYTDLLNVRNKHRLWLNCFVLIKQTWFLKAVRECDVVYIPRYCYPLIPFAKNLGKKVVVHLHDYQPVSYNAVVFDGTKKHCLFDADIARFEILEHRSIGRAVLSALTEPVNKLCRLWLKEADVLICVSYRQAEIISNLVPELAHKIKVIYNPLPKTPSLEEKFEHLTLTYPGGGSYIKGFHVFMQAVLKILKLKNDANFILAGGFRPRQRMIVRRMSNAFMGRLKLLGFIPHEEALRLYSKSHAVLVPSICEEALPYVVTEAMLAGALPIASKIGGIPEIVEGTFAEKMLFEPRNVEELIDRIKSLLSMSDEQIKDVGSGLKEAVQKRFDQEIIKEKLMKIFSAC